MNERALKFGRMQAGLTLTAIYILGVAVLITFKWSDLKDFPLNALGDFAAGDWPRSLANAKNLPDNMQEFNEDALCISLS